MSTSDGQSSSGPSNGQQPGPDRGRSTLHPANSLNELTGKQWIKFTKSWFVCDSPRYHRNKPTELHPARYPEELVADFVNFFTKAGAWVLDPFCGSGATLVACLEEGRRAIGIELSPKYVKTTQQRLQRLDALGNAQVLAGDARRLAEPALWHDCLACDDGDLPQFDFIITSPPYWNMLRQSRGGVESAHKKRDKKALDTHYSDAENDLGNIQDYDEFVEALGAVFDQCRGLLKPDKYMVVVAQNLRVPEGYVVPLAWDLQKRLSRTFSFQGERIWCQNSKQLGIWGYPKVFVPNYHHHYCLIFRNEQ